LSGVVLIASTAESGAAGRLVSILDSGVPTSVISAKVLVTAPTSTAFRGVALPPE
jgi:hypothetical protein